MRRFFCTLFLAIIAGPSLLCAQAAPAPVASQATSTVPPEAAAPGKDVVHQLNSAFEKVFETVAPSVVIIEVTKKNDGNETSLDDLFFQAPDDPHHRQMPEPVQSEGSGFIVRQDGYIYTNFHVVEGADKVEVKLKDGREFTAKVVGTDEKTDIAVVKVDATNLPIVQLADSDAVRVGQFAFAIGAPFKLDYTFTYGVISGKGRSKLLETGGYNIADYLQTDTSINPGNSGGPLCDIDGKVVGHEHAHQRSQPRARFRYPEQPGERNRHAVDRREENRPAMARDPDRNVRATILRSAICSRASIREWSCARSKPTHPPTRATCDRSTSSPKSTARRSRPTHSCSARF